MLVALLTLPLPSAGAAPADGERAGHERRAAVATRVSGAEIPSALDAAWSGPAKRPSLHLDGRNIAASTTTVVATAPVAIARAGRRVNACLRSEYEVTTTDPAAEGSWSVELLVLRGGKVVDRTGRFESGYVTDAPVVMTVGGVATLWRQGGHRYRRGDEVQVRITSRLEGGFDPFEQTITASAGPCSKPLR